MWPLQKREARQQERARNLKVALQHVMPAIKGFPDPGQPPVGPGHLASLDHLSITPGALSIATDPRAVKVGPGSRDATSPGPRKKKQRIVELTVVPQPETLRTTPTYF